jgi:2-polyprenyl-3-methyl-5-hydroxy-6-metoxy-1,4-benzoquinol methylase
MDYYIKYNIIKIPEYYKSGVRDDQNINVYKDISTGAFILDKNKKQLYEKNGLSYWSCKSIKDARLKTFDDDIRRFNQLTNINYDTILDFGCGNGGLLKILKEKKKDKNIIGIEINENLLEYLNFEGINTFACICEIPQNINFCCIMLNHVLEHLHDPIDILKKIKQRMNKKTLLIIEVPHANDFLINEYNCEKFKEFTFWSQHLILHTKQSLLNLLNIVGFLKIKIMFYQRYNIFNHLYWLNNGEPGGHKKTKYSDDNLINAYNEFLIKNEKTDTLIAHCYI